MQQMTECNKKETHGFREQTAGSQWVRAIQGLENEEAESIMYKINYKDTLYNMGNKITYLSLFRHGV